MYKRQDLLLHRLLLLLRAGRLTCGVGPAQGGRRKKRQDGRAGRQGIVQRLIQGEYQRIGQPHHRGGVKRRCALSLCGLHLRGLLF